MLPSRLFRSRWSALAWAAGIVWFAWGVADDAAPEGDRTPAIEVADAAALANLMR